MISKIRSQGFINFFIETLFSIVFFWGFLSWKNVDTLYGKFLLSFIYILIFNDWFASQTGNKLSNLALTFLTLFDIFLFTNMITSLTTTTVKLDYHISFWIYLCLLSLSYSLWDFLASNYVSDVSSKILIKWGYLMLLSFIICLFTYIGLEILVQNDIVNMRLPYPTILITIPGIFYWIVVLFIYTTSVYKFSQALQDFRK